MYYLLLLSGFLFSLDVLPGQVELPETLPNQAIISHEGYYLSYNELYEQANWVAYELTALELTGEAVRSNDFRSDSLISTVSASIYDYKNSGFDRGHLAPAADMKWSTKAMSESFYMSNISPQNPGFNRGIWRILESRVRNWAIANESVYVVVGGVLKKGLETIGDNEVAVPRYFFKVILDFKPPDLKGIGFVMPNMTSQESIEHYAVTIDSVEVLTGLDFFHSVPDSLEESIESTINPILWDLKE